MRINMNEKKKGVSVMNTLEDYEKQINRQKSCKDDFMEIKNEMGCIYGNCKHKPFRIDTSQNKLNSQRVLGVVKWFNNKLGYGFINHKNSRNEEQDIFVHWSNLIIPDHDFRTLYKDELVEFEIRQCTQSHYSTLNTESIQACKVSGPNRTKLATSKYNFKYHNNSYSCTRYSNVYSVKQLDLRELVSSERYSDRLISIYKDTHKILTNQ